VTAFTRVRQDGSPFEPVVLRAMVLMMIADGKIRETEEELIRRVHEGLTGSQPPPGLVESELASLNEEKRSVEAYLEEETEGWKERERRDLLMAACMVSVADRELVRDERVLLIRFGRALGLSAATVRGIHDELSQPGD
jgi:tellurite resistance protein